VKFIFICHRIPYPPNKGDKIRSYNLLRYLSRDHEVYLFCLIDNYRDIDHLNHLKSMVKHVFYDVINPKLKKAISCTALFAGTSISTRYFYSAKLQKAVDNVLEKEGVDLIFCFSSPTAEFVFRSTYYKRGVKDSIWAMDLIDMDSEKWSDYAKRSKWPQALIYSMEAKYLLKYETRIAKEFDQLFLVSEAEKALFLRKIKANNVTALPNGVDLTFFSQNHRSPLKKSGPTLVFTGAMDYWPNVDGVTWFATEIFPKVRELFPTAKFFVVGGDPAQEVKRLSRIAGVRVTGFVKDVRDYLSIADVCVVPLRIARGIQNKILEAMAMGKPVVTTHKALQGIGANPERDVFVADAPSEFAEHIIRILSNPRLASTVGSNGRRCVEKNYSWERSYSILSSTLSSLKSV